MAPHNKYTGARTPVRCDGMLMLKCRLFRLLGCGADSNETDALAGRLPLLCILMGVALPDTVLAGELS